MADEPMSDSGPLAGKSPRAALLAIFILALALRLFYIWQVSDAPFFTGLVVDQRAYDQWAQQISAGDWIGNEPFYQDPLYPYFLAVLYKAFGRDLALVYIIQAVLSSGCCLLMYGIGRRAFGDGRAGLLAALLWAGFKVDFFYEAQLLKTGPGICLLILGLWLALVAAEGGKKTAAAGAGLVMGLLVLVRGNYLLVAPLLLAWLAYKLYLHEGRRAAVPAAIALVSFIAVPSLTVARNWAVSGDFVITTSQAGTNFYMGNFRGNDWGAGVSPSFARRIPGLEEQDFAKEAEKRSGKKLDPSELSRFWFREGLKEIAADPGLALKRELHKALLIINRFEVSDNLSIDFFAENYSWLLKLPLPAFWLAAPFGLAGLALGLKRKKGGLLVLFTATYSCTLLVFYVLGRYRLPLAPALFALSAYAMVSGWDMAKKGERKALAALVVAVLTIGALGYPRFHKVTYDYTYLKMGNVFMSEGRFSEAIGAYRKALDINPELFQAWMGLGGALEDRMRTDEAHSAYERATRLDPESEEARQGLERTGKER